MRFQPLSLRSHSRRVVVGLLVLGVMAYLGLCLAAAICQRRLIYTPRRFTVEEAEAAAARARLERWRDASEAAIGFKRLSPRKPAAGQVLIVYGTGSHATGCAHYVDGLQSVAAVDAYILEYPGYADRAGTPTEKSLYHAADQALQLLSTNLPTFVVGESLGTAVAAYLAGTQPHRVAGVVLLSPFDRMSTVAQHRFPILPTGLLLIDRFPSADYLQDFHGPLAVVLDGRDRVVPPRFGKRLFDGYTGPKRLWQYPEGGHIDIGEPPARFWGAVVDFWQAPR